MATTDYGVNHPLTQKVWGKKLMREALKETFMSRFAGKTKGNLVYTKNELHKQAGDRIRIGLRMQLIGAGIVGDGTLEGNEEALSIYNDDIVVDQLRHAVRSDGRMSEQRVPFSVREEAMDGLRDWWADRIDTAFFNQISGNTGQTDTAYTGMQATAAPTFLSGNTRILYGDGDQTSENSLSSTATASNVMQVTFIDRAVTTAKMATPLIRPIKIEGGEERYVMFLHPHQVYNLRTDATANQVTWYDAQRAALQGGYRTKNPIFTGALGEYNGVILHESTRVPLAPNTTTVRRAILCGAQAACLATGQDSRENRMTWVEELFDLTDGVVTVH